MDKFLLNQSFQDFEIIIVNDNSNDNTEIITKSIMFKDQRIKIIKHSETLGVYASRVDAILASRGKYILLMDPDDMLLNPNLFLELYYYNLKNNLDIIEFTVFCFEEKNSELIIKDSRYHYHNLEGIIYQPELSNIFFYDSTTKNYSYVQCRNIWNKILRRELVLKTINYIGKDYYKKFFITAEDTIINLISLNFAKNYTNIKLPGYMYNIREISMTHGNFDERKQILFSYNHLLYLKKLYKYIKEFNKDRNFLYYEMQS
jgi:glycosyltransferase involved in cell wall biosynthesis